MISNRSNLYRPMSDQINDSACILHDCTDGPRLHQSSAPWPHSRLRHHECCPGDAVYAQQDGMQASHGRCPLGGHIRTRILPRQPSILAAAAAAVQRGDGTDLMAATEYQALVGTEVSIAEVSAHTDMMNTDAGMVLIAEVSMCHSQHKSETSPADVFALVQ